MGFMNVVLNRHLVDSAVADQRVALLFPELQRDDIAEVIRTLPGYAPTPTVPLSNWAAEISVGAIHVKDEAERFGLGSFKALGGAVAVFEHVRATLTGTLGERPDVAGLLSGDYAEHIQGITVATATDGNHGRSVAWGAQLLGCRCYIYMPTSVTMGRQRAVEAHGADVIRTDTNFDDCFAQVVEDCDRNGWTMISDTSTASYRDVPTMIMQGYRVMVEEALDALNDPPTHVFLQSGCGGLAAGVAAHLFARYGASEAPRLITVEPELAAPMVASILCGAPRVVEGSLATIMQGLSVGTLSEIAWELLAPLLYAATTIDEASIVDAMRATAHGIFGDEPIISGESGVVGLAAADIAARDERLRERLELDLGSRILVFNTEGRTDPELYEQLLSDGLPEDLHP